jgi:hypothetical protein
LAGQYRVDMAAWYKSTSVWAVVISIVAMVLSQLPPIVTWIPDPNIKVEHADRILIRNDIGIIAHDLSVELRNVGNTDIQITEMRLDVTHPDGKKVSFNAERFLNTSTGSNPVSSSISSIFIPRNRTWSEAVFFHRLTSTEDDERYIKIRSNIHQNMIANQQTKRKDQDYSTIIPADDEVVKTALNFFNKNFNLEKGPYKTLLKIYVNGKKEPFEYNSKFTLYDHHLDLIQSQTHDYKYGIGIFTPTTRTKKLWVKFEG